MAKSRKHTTAKPVELKPKAVKDKTAAEVRGGATAKVSTSELTVTKSTDKTSPGMF